MFGSVSNTSIFVTAILLKPFTNTECFTKSASNQPQRRGRPVVAPNSSPSSRTIAIKAGGNSVGKGPSPTRVVYAFTTPITSSIWAGLKPVPVMAPPADAFEDVTYG